MDQIIVNEKIIEFNQPINGRKLEIFKFPSPILKKICNPVTAFDQDLEDLCRNMLYTMYLAPGIGLAAPQVGKNVRIFVLDVDFKREKISLPDGTTKIVISNRNPMIFINPHITTFEGEIESEEGCLSVPGVFETVKRSSSISVDFFDQFGNPMNISAIDTLAVCIQHENDHLNGMIFLERLGSLKQGLVKKRYLKQLKSVEKS